MRRSYALGAGLAVLAALASGCGTKTTTVSGKVTYQGKPVVWGNVAVVASDGINYPATITLDGAFVIENVPVGPCKIGVNSPNPWGRSGGRGAAAEEKEGTVGLGTRIPQDTRPRPPAGAWFEVPDKYMDPLASGLTGEIKAGQPLVVDIP
jgi:hypothetical protein